jgi:hypothetical protein
LNINGIAVGFLPALSEPIQPNTPLDINNRIGAPMSIVRFLHWARSLKLLFPSFLTHSHPQSVSKKQNIRWVAIFNSMPKILTLRRSTGSVHFISTSTPGWITLMLEIFFSLPCLPCDVPNSNYRNTGSW